MTHAVDARTALLMTLPPLLWAANALVGRLMVGVVPPLTMNFLRWLLAAVILLALGWRVLRQPQSILRRWTYLLPLGLLGVGAYNALQYQALVTTTPLNVTLIASTTPVWMLVVGALFYGDRPSARQLVGAALCMTGALFVMVRGDVAQLAKIQLVPGDITILLATLAWAFYSWLLAKPPAFMQKQAPWLVADGQQQRPLLWSEFLLVQTLFGLLGAGGAAWVEQSSVTSPIPWSLGVMLALGFVAIGPSVVAYRCWALGVARGGPTVATLFANLTPVFAAVMSAAVLGERPQWYHLVAFALIASGILWSLRKAR